MKPELDYGIYRQNRLGLIWRHLFGKGRFQGSLIKNI